MSSRTVLRLFCILSIPALLVSLAGCGAVFVNQGSKNASLADAVRNPDAGKKAKKADVKGATCVFVDDSVAAIYPYGGANGSMSDDDVYSGKASLKCVLNGAEYSGVICDTGAMFDIKKAREDGYVLRFWIKGATGGEPIWLSLTDSKEDNKEVEVTLDFAKYGPVSSEWKQIEIPLKDFGDIGGYYDGSKMVDGVPCDWTKMEEFRVKDNRSGRALYTVYVDEVVVVPPKK